VEQPVTALDATDASAVTAAVVRDVHRIRRCPVALDDRRTSAFRQACANDPPEEG
jgi:hypothetical protein